MADGYVQDGETVYVEQDGVRLMKSGDSMSGSLTCTDSRLVFESRRRTIDISLRSITVLEYVRLGYELWYIVGGAVLLLIAFIIPELPPVPENLQTPGMALVILLGLGSIAYGIWGWWKDALVVRTPSGDFKFRGSNLSQFAHAVRGASN